MFHSTYCVLYKRNLHAVCLGFETNGFYDQNVYVLPWTSYPIQVSLTAVEDGVVVHLYDSLIYGAESFATWVQENVPIKISDLEHAPGLYNGAPGNRCKVAS